MDAKNGFAVFVVEVGFFDPTVRCGELLQALDTMVFFIRNVRQQHFEH
jgi:hypothetical protein